jgi:hypothetical protein
MRIDSKNTRKTFLVTGLFDFNAGSASTVVALSVGVSQYVKGTRCCWSLLKFIWAKCMLAHGLQHFYLI